MKSKIKLVIFFFFTFSLFLECHASKTEEEIIIEITRKVLFNSFKDKVDQEKLNFIISKAEDNSYTDKIFPHFMKIAIYQDFGVWSVTLLDEDKANSFLTPIGLARRVKTSLEVFIDLLDPNKILFFKNEIDSILNQSFDFWMDQAQLIVSTGAMPVFLTLAMVAKERYEKIKNYFPNQDNQPIFSQFFILSDSYPYWGAKNLQKRNSIISALIEFYNELIFHRSDEINSLWNALSVERPKDESELQFKIKMNIFNSFFSVKQSKNSEPTDYLNMDFAITEFLKKFNVEYVSEFKSNEIYYLILSAFIRSIDAHSKLILNEQTTSIGEKLDGKITGIGIEAEQALRGVRVMGIIVEGPSTACLMENESLLQVNDVIVSVQEVVNDNLQTPVFLGRLPLSKATEVLKGSEGTIVKVSFLRPNASEENLHHCTIRRREINLMTDGTKKTELVYSRNNKNFGVIKIPSFAYPITETAFLNKLNKINCKKQSNDCSPIDGLIIDVRGNQGGDIRSVSALVDELITEGPAVYGVSSYPVTRKGQLPRNSKLIDAFPEKTKRNPQFSFNKPIIVLIDLNSASASEILSGSLQVYNRALVMGTPHSYGKGTIQNFISLNLEDLDSTQIEDTSNLNSGSVVFQPNFSHFLFLTTGYFYLPNGQSNQLVGIQSDLVLKEISDDTKIYNIERNLQRVLPQPFPLNQNEIENFENAKWMSDQQKIDLTDRLKTYYEETIKNSITGKDQVKEQALYLLDRFIDIVSELGISGYSEVPEKN